VEEAQRAGGEATLLDRARRWASVRPPSTASLMVNLVMPVLSVAIARWGAGHAACVEDVP
jgi:hypothetical protein